MTAATWRAVAARMRRRCRRRRRRRGSRSSPGSRAGCRAVIAKPVIHRIRIGFRRRHAIGSVWRTSSGDADGVQAVEVEMDREHERQAASTTPWPRRRSPGSSGAARLASWDGDRSLHARKLRFDDRRCISPAHDGECALGRSRPGEGGRGSELRRGVGPRYGVATAAPRSTSPSARPRADGVPRRGRTRGARAARGARRRRRRSPARGLPARPRPPRPPASGRSSPARAPGSGCAGRAFDRADAVGHPLRRILQPVRRLVAAACVCSKPAGSIHICFAVEQPRRRRPGPARGAGAGSTGSSPCRAACSAPAPRRW